MTPLRVTSRCVTEWKKGTSVTNMFVILYYSMSVYSICLFTLQRYGWSIIFALLPTYCLDEIRRSGKKNHERTVSYTARPQHWSKFDIKIKYEILPHELFCYWI